MGEIIFIVVSIFLFDHLTLFTWMNSSVLCSKYFEESPGLYHPYQPMVYLLLIISQFYKFYHLLYNKCSSLFLSCVSVSFISPLL